jgi:V/A-type H+-transporting ATPase subunit E
MNENNTAARMMVDRILEKGHEENRIFYEGKKKQLEAELNRQVEVLKSDRALQVKRIDSRIAREYQQLYSRQELMFKQNVNQKKQFLIDEIFKTVFEDMKNWDREKFLKNAVPTLTANDLTGQVSVILGEYSKEFITGEQLKLLSESHGKVCYVLEEATVPGDGGFLLEQDGIEYNFLYSGIIGEIREKKEMELARQLFG